MVRTLHRAVVAGATAAVTLLGLGSGAMAGGLLNWGAVTADLTAPALPNAQVSALFRDVGSGSTAYALGQNVALPPASTLKLLVSATALADLGPGYRFATTVEGRASAGVVDGSVYLVGSGDPSLTSGDIARLAATLAQRVHTVRGAVVADASALSGPYGDGWDPADNDAGWQAIPSALTVNHGQFVMEVRPGAAPGDPVQVAVDPAVATDVRVTATTVAAGDQTTVNDLRVNGQPAAATVVGDVAAGASPIRLTMSVRDPALWAAELFAADLARDGVHVDGGVSVGRAPRGLNVLASHRSASLAGLLYNQDKWSINVSAEDLLRDVGRAQYGAPGTVSKGIAAEHAWLRREGIPWTGAIYDGSGLSTIDRVSAADLVGLLLKVRRMPWFPAFEHALPVAGASARQVSGTLGEIGLFTGFHGVVLAKTGDVALAENLAGYLRTSSGQWMAFAVLVNGLPFWEAGWRQEVKAIEVVAAP